ncbi:glycosyltransferase [Pseudoduganella sp. FT26W]|uniref:Glycosyltransferase n=1 Tax=Duganella aquatilis TaxID=2666082 RepID=A0A844D2D5_9BURK|nr:glycosyltransferase family 2 protein [Duganella aquatilis]MRW86258.1 glycosyltransferase [Duganella aquatilis]
MVERAPTQVAVVILNWNGWRDTVECLDSLLASTGVALRVIVCDNASRDESVPQLRAWADARFGKAGWSEAGKPADGAAPRHVADSPFVLLHNGGNLGFAGGNNPGIAYALNDPACAYIWLLNNDTTVEPDALAQAIARMEHDPRIGLCGSTLVYYHERDKVQAFGGASYTPAKGSSVHVGAFQPLAAIPATAEAVEASLSYVIGAAMLARRAFVEKVGLLTEDYFLYFEEIDWCTRGRAHFTLGYAPRSVVYHKEGASIGTSASGGSPLSVYYLFKNRLRFTARFHARHIPTVILFSLIDVAKFVYRQRWPQAYAAVRGMLQFPRTQPK